MDEFASLQSEPRPDPVELLQSGYRYALSLAHRAHDAEDLVQEAWLRLVRRNGFVDSRAILYTTIRNLFIDRCRRAKIVVFDSIEESQPDPPETGPTVPGMIDDLETLLGILRPGEREVIYLHHVEGRTAKEIGEMTAQPRGTVLCLLHRAYRKLRTHAAASES